MKKRITLLTLVLISLGVLAAAPMAFSGPNGRFGGHGMGGHGMMGGHHGGPGGGFAEGFLLGRLSHVREELDLSDAQVTQIQAIVETLREQNESYREQMRGGIHDVARTLIANPNDVAAAQAKLDAQNAAETAMKRNVLSASSKALLVLTPEQRTKLLALLDQRANRMKRFDR
jgi:protein CpxP